MKRMLIDAAHPEETRVAVLDGNQLEEFDVESASRKQLKGNIYLAKVTRVEPSLQAAFVDYGGNRHGFLAFNEIHPDYYQIPVADRERLIAEQEEEDAEAERAEEAQASQAANSGGAAEVAADGGVEGEAAQKPVETLGGDEMDEAGEQRRPPQRAMRRYKIQEVIKRRQILLVQVVKEERGNKGAALTTYLSLAGRYCVLMPNTGKGGGISRKIGGGQDRKRLKSIVSDLEIPPGMAMIVRTAGADRGKAEIKRDYDYLLRLWNDIRNLTLASTAPALIHGEANIINRAVRDLYTRDMEEIIVEGDDAYRMAKDLMKMLIPSHAKKVQAYKDDNVPLFSRYQIEHQLESMNSPTVQLKSGGYIVMNATEALVAIDVNSGRATRGRNIEETALKTNTEAATEIARQLRLRDLAGLIVIDFIDMDHSRNQTAVERRLKEAMRRDRARIQIGRISPFGLLELSRQRLRPSLAETVTDVCEHCGGTGIRRSTESTALHVLRGIEEEAMRRRAREIKVAMPTGVALYLLNHKRAHLNDIETKFETRVLIAGDDTLVPPKYTIERTQPIRAEGEAEDEERGERAEREPRRELRDAAPRPEAEGAAGEDGERRRRRRRRGRKRGNGHAGEDAGEELRARSDQPFEPADDHEHEHQHEAHEGTDFDAGEDAVTEHAAETAEGDLPSLPAQGEAGRRRRGRRGGRGRNRGRREDGEHRGVEAEGVQPSDETEGADGVPAEAQADEADAGAGAPAEGSRRRRVRRRNRGPRPEAASAADAEITPDSAAPTLWAATESNFEQPEAQESAAAEEATEAEEPRRDEAPEPPAYAEAASEPATEREPEPASFPQRVEEETPAGPPRRGWWQRLIE